jgi:hypothetical protein
LRHGRERPPAQQEDKDHKPSPAHNHCFLLAVATREESRELGRFFPEFVAVHHPISDQPIGAVERQQ